MQNCSYQKQLKGLLCYLMLLEFSVENIGCLFMYMLDGNVLSESHLCPVKPGSDHSQRTRQGLVQMDVPVQQLQLTAIKTHSTKARPLLIKAILIKTFPHVCRQSAYKRDFIPV